MTVSRAFVRSKLSTLIAAMCPSAGRNVEHGHVASLGNRSPVVVVSSGPARRPPLTFDGGLHSFTIYAHIFVLYEGEDWSERQSEDLLDAIESEIASMVVACRSLAGLPWVSLAYADSGTSMPPPPELAGLRYRYERIPLEITVA